MQDRWCELLVEPKAILGPYGGEPPALGSFAPHSLRTDFDEVSIAGRFLDLPRTPPASWGSGSEVRAHAVFLCLGVRRFECQGLLQRSDADDSMHGRPAGQRSDVALLALDAPPDDRSGPWRRFTLRQPGFSLVVEALAVMLRVGRQAWRDDGWTGG